MFKNVLKFLVIQCYCFRLRQKSVAESFDYGFLPKNFGELSILEFFKNKNGTKYAFLVHFVKICRMQRQKPLTKIS